MDKRNKIEFYLGNTELEKYILHTFLCPDDNDRFFIGKEIGIGDGKKLIYYFFPFNENEAILLACIEPQGRLLEAFKDYTQNDLDVLSKSFPKTIGAMKDGINGNLTNYAIIRLDCNGQEFDCVATKVTNLNLLDLDTEYLVTKGMNLCSFAASVKYELDWDKVTFWQKAQIVGGGILDGARAALKVYKINNFIDRILQ